LTMIDETDSDEPTSLLHNEIHFYQLQLNSVL